MPQRLCVCCLRAVPLDDNACIVPALRWGCGLCEDCKQLPPVLQHAIHTIKTNIPMYWISQHKEEISKILFSVIGTE